MSKTIKTYNDLLEEKERLTLLLARQRQTISDNWIDVKEELAPVGNVFGVLGKMAKGDKSNPLLNMGLKFAGDMLLKNFLFAKAGWITRLAVPFLVKNYSSHILADQSNSLFGKIGRIINRLGKKHKNSESDILRDDADLPFITPMNNEVHRG